MREELRIKIKNEDMPEFVGQIIDIFENFLEEKGISLDRDGDADEDAAIIHGDDYFRIEDKILDTLHNWSD